MSNHDPNSFEENGFEEENEFVSKSELKRQSKELHKLGETLVNLTAAHRATIAMDDELQEAVELAAGLSRKKDGFRRQLQFIGKLLRQRDVTDIQAGLAKLTHQHQASNAAFHAIEKARDAIIEQGDTAIQALLEKHEELDRQKLRQFYRQIKKEREKNGPPKAFRELFQYLKSIMPQA